jgi:hypothetical protein
MKRGYQISDDELRIEVIDRVDHSMRQASDEAMQLALMREHPERLTTSQPYGTKSPRRMPMPTDSSLKTNFD